MNSAAAAMFRLLKLLRVPVTRTGVQEAMKQQAGPTSLYSMGKSLNQWKVPHLCLQTASENLGLLPLPFIAHLTNNKGTFLVVIRVYEDAVFYQDEKEEAMPRSEFLQYWSGHVLLAEKVEGSGEKDFALNKREEKKKKVFAPLLITGILALSFFSWLIHDASIWLGVLLLLNLAGTAISAVLLLGELDKHHPLVQAFCPGGKGNSCTSLKQKNKSGLPSWSEMGLLYFGGSALCLLLQGSVSSFAVAAVVNLPALLFIPYSLYYQARVAKSWCRLCLCVLLLLALEGLVTVIFFNEIQWRFRISELLPFIVSYSSALLLIVAIKKIINGQAHTQKYRREANRLKYDPVVFHALLKEEKQMAIDKDMGLITGPSDADYTITAVCHPYCQPCARAHHALGQLMEAQSNIRLQVIFTATNEPGDTSTRPVQQLLALHEKDNELSAKALTDWYTVKKPGYEEFAAKYPVQNPEEQRARIDEMDKWCRSAGISFTPTVFINGRRLPQPYRVDDLSILLDE